MGIADLNLGEEPTPMWGGLNKIIEETLKENGHYKLNKIEVIEIIEQNMLNFNRGNVIKYVLRAPYKSNEIEDLKKALNYLHREIYGEWFDFSAKK